MMAKLDRFRLASARRLRATMTDEERILWSQIWRIPVEGTHFRRQASFGPYYPDFISHRLKLVIELDGSQHAENAAVAHDEARTRWMESQGYRVLRFWNHDVSRSLESVLDTIYAAVEERSATPRPGATRRPSPSRGG